MDPFLCDLDSAAFGSFAVSAGDSVESGTFEQKNLYYDEKILELGKILCYTIKVYEKTRGCILEMVPETVFPERGNQRKNLTKWRKET